VDVRPATEDDGAGIGAVRDAIGGQHDDSGSDAGYRAHLLEHGRLFVAVRDREVVGFAGTRDIGGHRLLSDLFVRPDLHGSGVGGALLSAVLDGSELRFTFSSTDPRALPLYARAGMRPLWPLLYLRGPAPSVEAGAAIEVDAVDPGEAAAIELRITGVDRSVEHRYWAARQDATAVVVSMSGRTVGAASSVRRGEACRLEHVALEAGLDAGPVVAAITRRSGAPVLRAFVPGPRPLLRWLLERRFVIDDLDTFMATEPSAVPDQLAVVHPGLA
jgi:hypothetical protein